MENLNCLFVGDLPRSCTENDLIQMLRPFGPIEDLLLKHNSTVPYAFITMGSREAGEEAIRSLNGTTFLGRLIRVNWAERPIRAASASQSGGSERSGGGSKAVSALYVRYSTHKYRHSLTEQNLSQVFNRFGMVEEVRIKESSMDEYTGRQSGYCFIHYPASPEGVQSAFQAVSCMNNAVVAGILFNVEFSKNLLKQIAKNTAGNAPISFGYFQRNPAPAQTPIDPSALPMARSGVYRDVDPGYLQQRSTAPRGHQFPPSFPSHQTGYSVTPPAAASPSHGEADRYLPPYIAPGRGAELSHWYPGSPHGALAARPAPHPSAFHAAAHQQQQQQQQQAPVTFDPSPRGPPFPNPAYPFPAPSPTYRGRGEVAFPAHGDDNNAFVGRSTAERLHAFPAQHQHHLPQPREEGYFLPPPARSADRDYASLMAAGGSGSGKTSVSGAPERESEERYAPASVFGAAPDFRPPGSVQTPSTLDADVSTNTSSNKSSQVALEEPGDRTRYFHTFAQRTSSSSVYTSESAATGSADHTGTPPLPGALPGLEEAGLHHSSHFHEHGHW